MRSVVAKTIGLGHEHAQQAVSIPHGVPAARKADQFLDGNSKDQESRE